MEVVLRGYCPSLGPLCFFVAFPGAIHPARSPCGSPTRAWGLGPLRLVPYAPVGAVQRLNKPQHPGSLRRGSLGLIGGGGKPGSRSYTHGEEGHTLRSPSSSSHSPSR